MFVLEVSACVYLNEQPQTRSFLSFQVGFTEKYEVKSDEHKMSLVLYTYPVKFFNRKWQYCTMSIYNKRRNIFGHWVLSRSHTDFDLNVEVSLEPLRYEEFIFEGSAYLSTIFSMQRERIYIEEYCASIGWNGRVSNWRGLTLEY